MDKLREDSKTVLKVSSCVMWMSCDLFLLGKRIDIIILTFILLFLFLFVFLVIFLLLPVCHF